MLRNTYALRTNEYTFPLGIMTIFKFMTIFNVSHAEKKL